MKYKNFSDKPRLCKANPFKKLLNKAMGWIGYIPEERFSQAAGALSDIKILATSCISPSARAETLAVGESILSRILASAHDVHRRPGWFIHFFEEELYSKYDSGKHNACSYDECSKSVAQKLK